MTRYSEEDWKRRGRGTKKRAPFKTSQTFLKKKKKIQELKERREGYELAVVKFSILEKSFLDFFCVRTIIPSPSNLLLLILLLFNT